MHVWYSPAGRLLASQLGSEHVPQGQAHSDPKVRLNDGEINEEDEIGDEDQGSVVKKVVGNQQEEERAEGYDPSPRLRLILWRFLFLF